MMTRYQLWEFIFEQEGSVENKSCPKITRYIVYHILHYYVKVTTSPVTFKLFPPDSSPM